MSNQLLLSYYGDDFTGSTDVMEVLALAGIRTILFLEPPTLEELSKYEGVKAVGVAGVSRSLPTEEMQAELTPIFNRLSKLNARIVHYKFCSTFDSSPEIGSIGRAIEIGAEIFQSGVVPVIVGAPALGRYVAFGNLFARSGGNSEVFRIDRHPTMCKHPVTPMNEADLAVHLSRQTSLPITLIAQPNLADKSRSRRLTSKQASESSPEIFLFDTMSERDLAEIGELIWALTATKPLFSASSSGLEYAITTFFERTGQRVGSPLISVPGEVDQLLILSGSLSPVTRRQIEHAKTVGFKELKVCLSGILSPNGHENEIMRVVKDAVKILKSGASLVVHTLEDALTTTRTPETQTDLSKRLGKMMRQILESFDLARTVVCGGDTSGYVARELGIVSLEMICPMAPGSPLCRISSTNHLHGAEILFKGGQVGHDNLFESILKGRLL